MQLVLNLVDEYENTLKQRVWYQKLSEVDYNIGCKDIIFCKIRDNQIVWKIYQYA